MIRYTYILILSFTIQLPIYAQTIIKVKRPYVLINTDNTIGKIDDEIFVFRGSNKIKIGKIKLVKFSQGKCAGIIIYEKTGTKIQIDDYVEQKINFNPLYENTIYFDLLLEFETPDVMGCKFLYRFKPGLFFGVKFNYATPNGKQYDWTQDRAENFYDSDFRGYSDPQSFGLNIGYVVTAFSKYLFPYAGIGYIKDDSYREYYDNTFTSWSNEYYIEDGKKSETIIDIIIGIYGKIIKTEPYLFTVGYSSGKKSISFGLGYSMPVPKSYGYRK